MESAVWESLVASGPLALILAVAVVALWKSRRNLERECALERKAWAVERSDLVAAKSIAAAAIREECAQRIEALTKRYEELIDRLIERSKNGGGRL